MPQEEAHHLTAFRKPLFPLGRRGRFPLEFREHLSN
jgi:hypothetical protein